MMKNFNLNVLLLFISGILLTGCNDLNQEKEEAVTPEPVTNEVLTEEERNALTPDDVLQHFKDGNERFLNNDLTVRDHQQRVRETALTQYPKAVVVSCVDSRVPVEDVFDQGLGDIFVGRIAGNFVDKEMLGSLEFATKVSGSKLVVIMGHQHCGAVKGAIDNVELGSLTATLDYIEPAIEMTSGFSEEEKSTTNEAYVQKVIHNNVAYYVDNIRSASPIMKEMEENGEIKIVGAYYDLASGKVTFMEQ